MKFTIKTKKSKEEVLNIIQEKQRIVNPAGLRFFTIGAIISKTKQK